MNSLETLKNQLSNAENVVSELEAQMQSAYNKQFDQNKELTDLLNNVENFSNYDYIRCGEFRNEVEYVYDASEVMGNFEVNELQYLQEYVNENFPCYLDIKEKNIICSDIECNFILDNREGKNVITSDGVFHEYYSDFHAFLIVEKHREESGCFGSLYRVDCYGNCEHYEKDHTEKAIMAYSGKDKVEKIDILLDYFNAMNDSVYLTIHKSIEDLFIDCNDLHDCHITNPDKKVIITYEVNIDDIEDYTETYLKELRKLGNVEFSEITDNSCRMIVKKEVDFQ